MKTKVGEYKGKVIVEGGENPENDLKPWEMLFPKVKESDENNAYVTIIRSTTELRVTNVTDSVLDYQLVQVVIPNSPFYGEVEGSQTRTNILAETIYTGEGDPTDYENIPTMDIVVGFYNNRNGFPFDPVNYRRCKLRIVASEDELEVDSNTKVFEGGISSVKFIKYTINLDNN